jgi:hypothetical protein
MPTHTSDAARALPLHLQLEHIAFVVFRDKRVVAQLEVWWTPVRHIVVLPNSRFTISRRFLH